MKKIGAILAALAIVLTFSACKSAEAQTPDSVTQSAKTPDKDLTIWEVLPEIPETPAAELEYTLLDDESGVKVTGYLGSGNAIRVPETIDGKPVFEVSFSGLNAEEIILPNSLKEAVLWQCKAKYINIPCDDMTISGEYALEKVYIEDNVTVISDALFAVQNALEQVRMGSGIKVIGAAAFQGCHALRELEIPESVEYIDAAAFGLELTKITLPSTLTALHKDAFKFASDNTEIVYNGKSYSRRDDELFRQFYPNDLLIYNNVVVDCWDDVSEIVIPDGVTEIGKYALAYQKEITKITLPSSVRVIDSGAFSECEKLTEIVIPEGVEELGVFVFDGCSSLKKIELPDSVSSLNNDAFSDISHDYAHAFTDFEVTYKGVTYSSKKSDMRKLYSCF